MNKKGIAAFGLVIWLIILMVSVVSAGSSANYAVNWWVMSGGGAPAASGSGGVALNGSLGQTAIGDSASAGGGYALGAGYWSGQGPAPGSEEWWIYLPIVLRNY